jgi:hypothetical protein
MARRRPAHRAARSWEELTPSQRAALQLGSPAGLAHAFGSLDAAKATYDALRDHPRLNRGRRPSAAALVFDHGDLRDPYEDVGTERDPRWLLQDWRP